jgi:hypothetical protein
MRIKDVLAEYGQILAPMSSAPRDGRTIVAFSSAGDAMFCYWSENPERLIGPLWIEHASAGLGYIDRFFAGWLDISKLRLLDQNCIHRLLVAYIDEARAAGETLTSLEEPLRASANDR